MAYAKKRLGDKSLYPQSFMKFFLVKIKKGDVGLKANIHLTLTGHRPNKLAGYDLKHQSYKKLQKDLEVIIENKLKKFNIVWCHSGLALGADTIWSKAILKMKEKYPTHIFFHAEIPMVSQKDQWFKKQDIDFWHKQVGFADRVTVYDWQFSNAPEKDKKWLAGKVMQNRNIGMIDACDILIAVYDGHSKGGTYNAITYAKKINKEILELNTKKYF